MINLTNSKLVLLKKIKGVMVAFTEGETNIRKCNKGCLVCGKPIEALEGYRLINTSSYEFIHRDCKYQLTNVDTIDSKLTKVPMLYDITVWTKENIVHTLIQSSWTKAGNNCIKAKMFNLNPLKVIDTLYCSRVIATITNTVTNKSQKVTIKDSKGIIAHNVIDNVSIELGKYKY